MKSLHLITVGKYRDKNFESLEADFLKRIVRPKLLIHECKTFQENLFLEGEEVLKKIVQLEKDEGSCKVVLLSEHAKTMSTSEFSQMIQADLERSTSLIFVIGGASGHGPQVIEKASMKLSLSPMTFPHKMARMLFVEQIYRAQTVRENHPYHKD